ncbi:MAG TPA: methylmalonyl-CoA epimerase [Gemmatimonadota bacterium]|nr:methylmalonyl-CoA epimerase [Gemmatimonadota bacterium]
MNKIDHIGIAVNSLAEAVPAFSALLGSNSRGEEDVPSEGVRVAFFGEGSGRIELLEATSPDSPVARFLEKRGEGVHHVCLAVTDLDAALERADDAGLRVLDPRIRPGAGGRRVAFLHPKTTSGVLIELSEGDEPGG